MEQQVPVSQSARVLHRVHDVCLALNSADLAKEDGRDFRQQARPWVSGRRTDLGQEEAWLLLAGWAGL